ncbi:unnamed protein product [Owenia fusiformis]|uniref:Metalloendopeptidase n=1 Tax=Owenia fusiformis TaxID=6347 RepID=A0A8J1U010_OWEFU|nr:unnamed protein product [Owenia fusiformis]
MKVLLGLVSVLIVALAVAKPSGDINEKSTDDDPTLNEVETQGVEDNLEQNGEDNDRSNGEDNVDGSGVDSSEEETTTESNNETHENPDEKSEGESNVVEGDIKLRDGTKKFKNAYKMSSWIKLWPNGQVIYTIGSFSAKGRAMINAAMAQITRQTDGCITFKQRTYERDYLDITQKSGCWSYIGMQYDFGAATVSLDEPACTYGNGTAMHEFVHALGFWHEHTRSDRDNYVSIDFSNILDSQRDNFEKQDTDNLVGYDFDSIMHYSNYAFSKNGGMTIHPKKAGVKIGQRARLSALDVQEIKALYKCDTGSPTHTEAPRTVEPTTPRPTFKPYTFKPYTSKPYTVKPYIPPTTQAPGGPIYGAAQFTCTFETDAYCGLKNLFTFEGNGAMLWKRQSAREARKKPKSEVNFHSRNQGWYMMAKGSSCSTPQTCIAILDSEWISGGDYCLLFNHFIYNSDSRITLFIVSDGSASIRPIRSWGSGTAAFQPSIIPIHEDGRFQVRIQAEVNTGDVSIDNIQLRPKPYQGGCGNLNIFSS